MNALSCAPPRAVEQEMGTSSTVFKGEVLETKKDGLAIFQVEEVWKGVNQPTVEIYDNGWDPFNEGAEYLVLGNVREGKLRANLCGNTGLWNSQREQAMKNTGIPSTVPAAGVKEYERPTGLAWASTLLILGLIALIVLGWRKFKP